MNPLTLIRAYLARRRFERDQAEAERLHDAARRDLRHEYMNIHMDSVNPDRELS